MQYTRSKEQAMWYYGLLATPVVGLALFFMLPFEWAFILYLLGVFLVFGIYCWLADRQAKRR